MQKQLNILIADDDEGDRKQIRRALNQSGLQCICTETGSIDEALEACKKCDFDSAIIDYRLPGRDGLAGITALHGHLPWMAIIMVTGQGDEAVATEAMKRGSSDYIPKTQITAQSIRNGIEKSVERATLQKTVSRQREELELFASVLVHDLKAPIWTILGYTSLIEEGIRTGNHEEIVSNCDPVIRGVKRMAALINTLYLYTRAEALVDLEPVEMREVMIDTLANLGLLIEERGARVTYGDLPTVSGTPQLGQLLQNLIGNGIKYCEAAIPSVHVSAQPREGNIWLFSVKDNGIGIPEKHHQKLFVPFNRVYGATKREGTGLGLATCKKIVERHGGVISLESREGQGTTFYFTLRGA
jgi:signal transduction histidine kinase